MEPPKPHKKAEVLQKVKDATSEEYDEYERLLSKSFSKDPSLPPQPSLNSAGVELDADSVRLKELTKKLFPDA